MNTTLPEPSAEPDLHQMLRIMDVARTLRREREVVEQQFNIDQTKALLRQRLLASTEITGEQLSAAEVDAALDLYFNNLHTFREPDGGLQTFLAHLYIRRRTVAAWLVALCLIVAALWGLGLFG